MVLIENKSLRERVMQSAVIRQENGLSILTFFAMGTVCKVTLVEPTRTVANQFLEQTLHWVADFEANYSRFIDSSLIGRINRAAGRDWVKIDEQTEQLLAMCDEFHFFTQGAFDPTALPLIRLWNWKANPPSIPSAADIENARELVGWKKVQRRRNAIFLPKAGMALDLGGIGKEFAVDSVMKIAMNFEVSDILIDFGQDIRTHGKPPGKPAWHVGLENPKNAGTCWASVALTDHAVATSGDYLRCFIANGRRYGHILDPRTGYPVYNGTLCVTVIAASCTMAGILSTSAFILGPGAGFDLIQRSYGTSGSIVTETDKSITPRMYEHIVNLQKN